MGCGRVPTLGIAERILDCHAHVGGSQLRLHGAVRKLNGGVDLALAVHEDLDVVDGHVEEVVCLDDLKALVHERGAVDRDLCAHLPRGMRQGIRSRDVCELGSAAAKEWASGARDPDLSHVMPALANEALVDGVVL